MDKIFIDLKSNYRKMCYVLQPYTMTNAVITIIRGATALTFIESLPTILLFITTVCGLGSQRFYS